jgi:hypothetical protein
MASPIPLLLPVTSAFLPSNCKSIAKSPLCIAAAS